MKKATFILLIFLSINLYSQKTKYPKDLVSIDTGNGTSLILNRPITNREYLIYLMWTANIHIDYPENLINAMPILKGYSNYLKNTWNYNTYYRGIFNELFKYCPGFVENYMFNLKYIDYPVIGLSWYQASIFNKWLTDRWNEYRLIKLRHYRFDTGQIAEECFTTEAYLADQYYGSWNGKDKVTWGDNIFLSTFTLPTSMEIQETDNLEIKEYPFDKKSFLSQWNRFYFEVNDSSILFKHWHYNSELVKVKTQNFKFGDYKLSELLLNNNGVGNDKKKIFWEENLKELNYSEKSLLEKDSVGRMGYFILEYLSNEPPIVIENYKAEPPNLNDTININYFRFSVKQ